MEPDVKRGFEIGGGFDDRYAKNDPKAFTYQFQDNIFPNVPLIQPRLNSVEEWKFTNYNNDSHPIHIHVNDFQVQQVVSPLIGTTTGVQPFGIDNANVPPPEIDENDTATKTSSLTLRSDFIEYAGTYVVHCHRLNHEDNGLMMTINVIPEVSTYAVAVPGSGGRPAAVRIYDGNGDKVIAYVTPFPGFEGTPSVAMADVNGDMILDLIVGTGAGVDSQVAVYDGNDSSQGRFTAELARFAPFDAGFHGGVTVAGADIDGNAMADNMIVASGPGMDSQVKVFSTTLPNDEGTAPEVFSAFTPYPGSTSGVSDCDRHGGAGLGPGVSIVTAPGPGDAPDVKTFRYDLYQPTARARANGTAGEHGGKPNEPTMTAKFMAYDEGYTGGVSLTTGWVAGVEGGAKSIVTGQLDGRGHRAGMVDGLAARRLSRHVRRESEPPRRRPEVLPDRIVRALRPRLGGDGGDHQHHQRCGPPGQRRRAGRSHGAQTRTRQVESDRHHGGADRRRDAADARRGRRSRSAGRAVS